MYTKIYEKSQIRTCTRTHAHTSLPNFVFVMLIFREMTVKNKIIPTTSKHFQNAYFVTNFSSNETSGCVTVIYHSKQRS